MTADAPHFFIADEGNGPMLFAGRDIKDPYRRPMLHRPDVVSTEDDRVGVVLWELFVKSVESAPVMRFVKITEVEWDNLLADLADVVHTGRTHQGRACDGDNDGCEGGPDSLELELGESALSCVVNDLGLRLPLPDVSSAAP